jgi:hypothetical protein
MSLRSAPPRSRARSASPTHLTHSRCGGAINSRAFAHAHGEARPRSHNVKRDAVNCVAPPRRAPPARAQLRGEAVARRTRAL